MTKKDYYTLKNINFGDIAELSKNPELFASVITINPQPFFNSVFYIKSMVRDKTMSNPKFRSAFNHNFSKIYIDGIKNHPYLGNPEVNILGKVQKYLYNDITLKFMDSIYENISKFNYAGQKTIIRKYLFFYKDQESKILDVFKKYHSKLDKDILYFILERITNGINNPEIIKILNSNNKIGTIKYTEEILKDDAQRIELLKNLATTPTSAKFLNCAVEFSFDDLKKIAPVMRFKFLQFLFKNKIYYGNTNFISYYGWNVSKIETYISRGDKKANIQSIKIADLTKEQLNDLLFSVGIKKNNQVVEFIDKYEKYKQVISKKANQKGI